MTTATATYEIRSYTLNSGGSWEWNGDGWDVEAVCADAALESAEQSGDWSAYAAGEPCLLRAYRADGLCLAERRFVPNAA